MESGKVTHNNFMEIAQTHDYFLWHFIQKNQNDGNLLIRSVFDEINHESVGQLNILLKEINIPYFESYIEDSIDFIHELGIPFNKLWNPNFTFDNGNKYHPVIIGFKKFEKIDTTFDVCYCIDGVVKIIGKINPELILRHQC